MRCSQFNHVPCRDQPSLNEPNAILFVQSTTTQSSAIIIVLHHIIQRTCSNMTFCTNEGHGTCNVAISSLSIRITTYPQQQQQHIIKFHSSSSSSSSSSSHRHQCVKRCRRRDRICVWYDQPSVSLPQCWPTHPIYTPTTFTHTISGCFHFYIEQHHLTTLCLVLMRDTLVRHHRGILLLMSTSNMFGVGEKRERLGHFLSNNEQRVPRKYRTTFPQSVSNEKASAAQLQHHSTTTMSDNTKNKRFRLFFFWHKNFARLHQRAHTTGETTHSTHDTTHVQTTYFWQGRRADRLRAPLTSDDYTQVENTNGSNKTKTRRWWCVCVACSTRSRNTRQSHTTLISYIYQWIHNDIVVVVIHIK